MALLAPEVKGPVSVCSKRVRIKGHIAGSTVSVFVNGNQTSSKASSWPDDVFDVGTTLNQGDKITATQQFGGDVSPQSPLPAIVQNVPVTLASLTILTDLHACGSAVWSEGAVPGADVRVVINGNQAGSATSIDGIARMKYSPVLNVSQTLSLQQTTCTGLTNATVSQPAKPLPNVLPIPAIAQPLIECMTAIKIGKVIDGATVTIYRNGVKEAGGAFDRPSLTWIGLKPLEEGDLIEVDQSFTCRRRGSPERGDPPPTHLSGKGSAKVQSASNLPKPVILAPVCPDPILITVSNLLPSARVILYADGVEVGMTDTPESTFSFSAPSLGPNAKLTARMQLCGKDGPLSGTVEVQGDKPLQELQVSKLYECSSYIFIVHWHAPASGKIAYAVNKNGDVISAYHQVFTPFSLFPVSPALIAGDEIRIVVLGCSGAKEEFGPFLVAPLDWLPVPTVKEPVPESTTGVAVYSEVAGAIIEVYVDGVYRAQAVSFGDALQTSVNVGQPPLQFGQTVTARQSFCGTVSKFSKPVTVVIPYPQPPQLTQPAKFATGIPAQPATFTWKDPGANSSAAATSFKLKVYRDSDFSLAFETTGSFLQADANLDYSSGYTWNVTAFNSTGHSQSPSSTFETAPPPAPEEEPPAQNAALAFVSPLYASYDGMTWVWPLPGNTAFYLCVIVGNAGNATSDPFEIVFSWDGNGLSGTQTVTGPAAAPGWSDIAYVTFASGLPEGYYNFHATLLVNGTPLQNTAWIQAWVGF